MKLPVAIDKLAIHYTNQLLSKDCAYFVGAVMTSVICTSQDVTDESYPWSHNT